MTARNVARNIFDLPDLPPEHRLLWAVAHQARLDASYRPRPGNRPEVSEQERQEARAFLEEFRQALSACV